MRLPLPAALCLLVALAWPADASARRGRNDCGSMCLQAPGSYLSSGLVAWPQGVGVALTAGAFHRYRVGVEASAWMPLGDLPPGETRPILSLLARLTVLEEGLGAPWEEASAAGLVLSLRGGLALNAGAEEGLAFALGPAADLVLFGAVLVSLRPLVALVPDREPPPGAVPLRAFPLVELSVGLLTGDDCGLGGGRRR